MKKTLLVAALLVAIIAACRQTDRATSFLLNTSRLTSLLFTVDITKDTTLLTPKGAIIKLPKGTLESTGGNLVQLEIREAYSMEDIITAGLITRINGQPLSSGGMIYINAVGANTVRISKAITIATPTPFIEPNMQLFKGEVQPDSTINWTNPAPLPPNPQQAGLDAGKLLFDNNCATCHKIESHLTGPTLAHIVKRAEMAGDSARTKLYAYTRNNQKVLAEGDPYYCALYKKWNMTPMNIFPFLTDQELDNLYDYIQNESDRLRLLIPNNRLRQCVDSCIKYNLVAGKLNKLKKELEQDSNRMVNEERDTTGLPIVPFFPENMVNTRSNRSLYYQFTIEAFGWYNVDILLKDLPGMKESTLTVRMQGTYRKNFQLYLAIPDIKLLTQAGPLKNGEDSYGFFTNDGKIPLPQDARAWVFAVSEQEGKIFYAGQSFTTATSQTLFLELSATTMDKFQQVVRQMGIPGIKIQVAEKQTGIELRKAIKDLKNAEQLKPVNCDCNCLPSTDEPRISPGMAYQ